MQHISPVLSEGAHLYYKVSYFKIKLNISVKNEQFPWKADTGHSISSLIIV